MRTPEEIVRDILAGRLEIADVRVSEVAVLEKIDKSGDEPKLIERRTMVDGKCVEVEKF